MKKRWIWALLLCLILLLVACGLAEADSSGSSGTPGGPESSYTGTTASGNGHGTASGTPGTPMGTTAGGSTNSPSGPANSTVGSTAGTVGSTEGTDNTPDIPAGSTAGTAGATEPDFSGDPLPGMTDALYEQLFDPANKIEIDLDMENSELAKMQADFEANSKSPIYRRADMTIVITGADGTSASYRIEDVGVRMKGNTSRTNFYSAQEGIYNAIHLKIDFQETFDDAEYYGADAQIWTDKAARDARKDRTFAGLEKLDLRWNKCYDSSYLRESYAYGLFRSFGVMAPLTNLCSLDWGGLHMGVYTLNEPVDKLFLEKRLPDQALGGDLYKLGWTNHGADFTSTDSIGIEDELAGKFYVYDLKTNKKTSTHAALKNLISQLNSGRLTKEGFARLVDVENFLNFAAVSYFAGNPDDLRYNYNNCYVYFRADTGQALFIPYDFDRCFGITYEWNPSGDGMVSQDPFSDQSVTGRQENPLFRYSVVKGAYFISEYTQALQAVADSPLLEPAAFQACFDAAKALYGADVTPGKTLHNGNGRNWSFSLTQSENLSFASYITAKLQHFNSCIRDTDSSTQAVTHYIRGDFNDWSSNSAWAMESREGLMYFTLDFDKDFRFKVYAEASGSWYGVDSFPEDCTLEYTTDSHGNVCLGPGSYRVCFDPETELLTVTPLE